MRRFTRPFLVLLVPVLLTLGVAHAEASTEHVFETGYASWYAGKFQGRLTASGERFDTNQLTAAHKTLPFGTIVEVTHLRNGRSVRVRINDRGPFVESRIIDLSRAAAEAIGMTAEGVARVSLRIVTEPQEPTKRIQVAAFSSRDNADSTVTRLRNAGLDAEIEESTVYRVVIRGVRISELDDVQRRLAATGFRNVLVKDE